MKKKNTVNNKLKKLEDRLEQRKSDQKEILLERIRDKEHAEIYTEMLENCEKDIRQITEEIESIKDYNKQNLQNIMRFTEKTVWSIILYCKGKNDWQTHDLNDSLEVNLS